jgi:septal ring factor EnvC (AmiA/AmiB activator)
LYDLKSINSEKNKEIETLRSEIISQKENIRDVEKQNALLLKKNDDLEKEIASLRKHESQLIKENSLLGTKLLTMKNEMVAII